MVFPTTHVGTNRITMATVTPYNTSCWAGIRTGVTAHTNTKINVTTMRINARMETSQLVDQLFLSVVLRIPHWHGKCGKQRSPQAA
jgi:hypothetical protein